MSGNVFFVCLDYDYVGQIANEIALSGDKFFLDVNQLFEYSLMGTQRVKNICGLEYLKKEQKKILLNIKEYENTFINIPYDFVIDEEYKDFIDKCFIVFVELDKKELLNNNFTKNADNNLDVELMVVDELNTLIRNKSKIIINSNGNLKEDIKKIKNELKNN